MQKMAEVVSTHIGACWVMSMCLLGDHLYSLRKVTLPLRASIIEFNDCLSIQCLADVFRESLSLCPEGGLQ